MKRGIVWVGVAEGEGDLRVGGEKVSLLPSLASVGMGRVVSSTESALKTGSSSRVATCKAVQERWEKKR